MEKEAQEGDVKKVTATSEARSSWHMEITSDKSEQGQIEMPGKISLWVTVSPLAKFQLSSLF